jgi:hypothetical protein
VRYICYVIYARYMYLIGLVVSYMLHTYIICRHLYACILRCRHFILVRMNNVIV